MRVVNKEFNIEQEKFSNDAPEEVILIPRPREIRINPTLPARAYGLFDTKTGTQVKDFVKGNGGQIEFKDLEPSMHYDVGVIENPGDDKPYFAIAWNTRMRDDTDTILSNSDDLPVVYPKIYTIKYKNGNSNGVYDLVDENGDTVGQVAQLSGDKPEFAWIRSFRMKDDTIN